MTFCNLSIRNTTDKVVSSVGFSGSDFGFFQQKDVEPSTGWTNIIDMGCPGRSETAHWGFVYLKKSNSQGSVYFTVYWKLNHSGHIAELGAEYNNMNNDGDTPQHRPESSLAGDGGSQWTKQIPGLGHITWTPDKDNGGSPKLEFTFNEFK
ncbi:hypothetical protein CMUS01_05387 [Colletotrichum musicola]|uniref:Uncharacterized protein n=1 Tax=Colletotrichum musicola TaxID=2175873 RepID=A0A8H6NK17_9PEZI|nr:hypothetical protein CMUS01_05387 [Colletotrichum musicola]